MKSLNKNNQGLVAGVLLVWFILIGALIWLVSLWTDRNLEFWLSYAKGVPVDVPGWLSFLLTLVLNGVAIALNLIAEIARLLV